MRVGKLLLILHLGYMKILKPKFLQSLNICLGEELNHSLRSRYSEPDRMECGIRGVRNYLKVVF